MSALTEFLFPAPAPRRLWSILGWWERRRLPYNLIVGGAGLVSLAAANLFAMLPPHAMGTAVPLAGIAVFGVFANLFYFLGPTVEIALERLSGGQILPTGPSLYRMGLTFSVGLAMLPTLLMGLVWVGRLVGLIP